jgi:bifunctional enzyme CysN/CysC
MDAAHYSESAFAAVSAEITGYLQQIGVTPSCIIPLSARDGDNIVNKSPHTPYYTGPTVLEALGQFTPTRVLLGKPLRFPVQDVYKFDDRRILAGRVESGTLTVGDILTFSPSNARARVTSIVHWPERPCDSASASECIGVTLDEPIFVERGHIASHADSAPFITSMFRARIFWLGANPLQKEKHYKLKLATTEVMAEVREIEAVISTDSLERSKGNTVDKGMVAEILLRTRGVVAVDAHTENPVTGRFVIVEGCDAVGGGIIDLTGFSDQRVSLGTTKSTHISPFSLDVTPHQRALKNGHTGGVLWFTGLSGAGKTTVAQGLQKALFAKGYQVFVLDGDNVRKGLCRDLGFAPDDRTENLRRAGEVAALFAQAGFIVITSFISPTHADRTIARAASPEYFHSVYIKADLSTCEQRDVKGLYKKARAGEIPQFTGISAPYEEPEHPDVVIDTMHRDVATCVEQLVRYVQRQFVDVVQQPAEVSAEYYQASGI